MDKPIEYEGVYEVLKAIDEPQQMLPGELARESVLPPHRDQFERDGTIRLIGFVRRDR